MENLNNSHRPGHFNSGSQDQKPNARVENKWYKPGFRFPGNGFKQKKILFRLALTYKPSKSLTISKHFNWATLYLAAGKSSGLVASILGNTNSLAPSVLTSGEGVTGNIRYHPNADLSNLRRYLRSGEIFDLVYIKIQEVEEEAITLLDTLLPWLREESIIVFDGIHHQPTSWETWKKLKVHPRVNLSIELFELGFLFFSLAIREPQHRVLAPLRWKPWKKFVL